METGPNGPNPPVRPQGTRTPPPAEAPAVGEAPAPKVTEPMLIEAIDWAVRQNDDPASRLYQKLGTAHIAVIGQSCGGTQAESIGA